MTTQNAFPQRSSRQQRLCHVTRTAAIGSALAISILLLLRCLCLPVLVFLYPTVETYLYDTGIYGAYPEDHYISSDLVSPLSNVVQWDDSCSDGLVLLDVHGPSVANSGPMIVDMQGNLVWSAPGKYGASSANTKIQTYRDTEYLTFWSGEKLQESGLGNYYMLNSSYDLVHVVSAVGQDVQGDMHEFKITRDNTALIIVYHRSPIDLGTTNVELEKTSPIVDGILQEIDIQTGQLIFEWRASDHLGIPSLQHSHGDYLQDGAFDYFHMNSADKDSQGNYLVSLRNLHTIVYINGISGNIIWAVGGVSQDFDDLTDGEATGFEWQHDARWVDEEQGIISIFDNGMARKHYDSPYSQGLLVQLDLDARTADLLQSYRSRNEIGSASQGAVQVLERTNEDDPEHVFIGWGASAAFTEHSLGGELLCETHFGASALFYFERVKSYRAFKMFSWKATPTTWDPIAKYQRSEVFVSWNGATEVHWWILQGRRGDDDDFEDIDAVLKGSAFETSFALSSEHDCVAYRVVALDENGNVLRNSNTVAPEQSSAWLQILAIVIFVASALAACPLSYAYRDTLRRAWTKCRSAGSEGAHYHVLTELTWKVRRFDI